MSSAIASWAPEQNPRFAGWSVVLFKMGAAFHRANFCRPIEAIGSAEAGKPLPKEKD